VEFGFRAGLFPWAIGIPVLALSLLQLVLQLAGKAKLGGRETGPEVDLPTRVAFRRSLEMIAWILAFYVVIWLLGFSYAFPVSTLLYLKSAGREKWPITLFLSFVSWAFVYGLFDHYLRIPFPEGKLFVWLSQ
jgi:hypothetical protein